MAWNRFARFVGWTSLALGCASVACERGSAGGSDDGSGGAGGAGGAGGTAGTGGVAEDGGSAGQGGAIGGAGGAPNVCGVFNPSGQDCGFCVMTLEEYCDEPDKCFWTVEPTCQEPGVVHRVVEEGCGLLRLTWSGDVGDQGVTVWTLGGDLVYSWNNGAASAGCSPDTRIGVEPECDDWTLACDRQGAGGAGGGSGD